MTKEGLNIRLPIIVCDDFEPRMAIAVRMVADRPYHKVPRYVEPLQEQIDEGEKS